jgi:lysophospholipase L1-like esterase
MPDVVLIGDSIRMGYQAVVAEALADCAMVWGPEANCWNSANVLAHIDEWVIARQPDLVHLNCGLHDLKRAYDSPAHEVEPAAYRANIEAILQRILHETRAAVIWATITPVNEAWHHATKGFDRFAADVALYNALALEVVRASAVPVNDLYATVMQAGRDTLLVPDGVHFNEAGSALLGQTVADTIRARLVAGEG